MPRRSPEPRRPPPAPAQRGPGRPRKLDAAAQDVAVALTAAGWSRAATARYLGVVPQTIVNAASRDQAFADRLDLAAATPRVEHSWALTNRRSWRASAWALERLAPELFADPASRSARRRAAARRRRAIGRLLEEVAQILAAEVDDPALRQRLTQWLQAAIRRRLIEGDASGSFRGDRAA